MRVARLLRMIAAARRPVATIVIAEPYDPEQASTLLRMGMADCLALPVDEKRLGYLIEVLTVRYREASLLVARAGASAGHAASHRSPDSDSASTTATSAVASSRRAELPLLAGSSSHVVTLVDQIRRVAPQNATILLGGETGTGKSRLAHRIYQILDRHDEPFTVVDCGLLSGSLIEQELFGHVQGAFEGAGADRGGRLARAGRGTLFLRWGRLAADGRPDRDPPRGRGAGLRADRRHPDPAAPGPADRREQSAAR